MVPNGHTPLFLTLTHACTITTAVDHCLAQLLCSSSYLLFLQDGHTPLHLVLVHADVDRAAVKDCLNELLTVQVPGGRKALVDTYDKVGCLSELHTIPCPDSPCSGRPVAAAVAIVNTLGWPYTDHACCVHWLCRC